MFMHAPSSPAIQGMPQGGKPWTLVGFLSAASSLASSFLLGQLSRIFIAVTFLYDRLTFSLDIYKVKGKSSVEIGVVCAFPHASNSTPSPMGVEETQPLRAMDRLSPSVQASNVTIAGAEVIPRFP